MRQLIKGDEKQFIVVTKFGAKWTDNKLKFKITFDKASLKLTINFLLDNCFFVKFGNLSFPQITGIPMGSDPAPFMANLFLYYDENKWLLGTKKRFTYSTPF